MTGEEREEERERDVDVLGIDSVLLNLRRSSYLLS